MNLFAKECRSCFLTWIISYPPTVSKVSLTWPGLWNKSRPDPSASPWLVWSGRQLVEDFAESSNGLTASIRIFSQFVELAWRCAVCFSPAMSAADHSCVRSGSNDNNEYRPRNPEDS